MHRLPLILVVTLVPVLQAGTRRAYLPATGPVPLRFQATRSPGVTNFALPPLDPGKFAEEPEPARAGQTNVLQSATNQPPKVAPVAVAPAQVATNQPPAVAAQTNLAAANPPVTVTQPAAEPPPNADLISAQKLVQFFKFGSASTNGNNTAVVVPVQFAPPPPVANPPGSTATYRTP